MRINIERILLVLPLCSVLGLARPQADRTIKLYVTNSEGDNITVIDLTSLRVVGEIKVGQRVHGACTQADGKWLFTSIESQNSLKVIDTATDSILDTIPLTGRPNQCAATPDGRFVGVPIRDGESVDIVDVAKKKVVKVLPVKIPHNCYNAGNNRHMFVSSMGEHRINLIDLATMSYIAQIPVGGVPRPFAVSRDEKTMYVALTDFLGFAIVDIPAGRVRAKVQLPAPPPGAELLEPNTPTHGLDLTPDGKELWVTSTGDCVYVYDIATKKLSSSIATGKRPNWLTFSPDGRYCAVSNVGSDDCSIIDTRTRREVARLKVGKEPKRLVAINVIASAAP